jgi:hypothetical protein
MGAHPAPVVVSAAQRRAEAVMTYDTIAAVLLLLVFVMWVAVVVSHLAI